MKLWLVRHGQTQANIEGLYCGLTDTNLTSLGEHQAKSLGAMLHDVPFDKVICSELNRTQTTARFILEQRSLPISIEPILNEMNFGDWEMRHHRELQEIDSENYAAWCADWQNSIPTNGEGFQAFSQRINSFAERIRSNNHDENILIVSHQGVLGVLLSQFLHMPSSSLWHFTLEQGAWSQVDFHQDFAVVRCLNNRAKWQSPL